MRAVVVVAAAAGLVAAGSAAGSAAAAAAGAFAGRSAMADDMQPSRRGYAPTVIFGVRDGAMVEDGVGTALA